MQEIKEIQDARLVMPGVLAIQTGTFSDTAAALKEAESLDRQLQSRLQDLQAFPLMVWCDDASFTSANLRNFLWVTFTRSNPSHDIHGVAAFTEFKHWGCKGPVIIDARIKPHHAPAVVPDPVVEKNIERIFSAGGSLAGL
jgi:4-hydroxy-3-polyprenylbenzoate decarboxylase